MINWTPKQLEQKKLDSNSQAFLRLSLTSVLVSVSHSLVWYSCWHFIGSSPREKLLHVSGEKYNTNIIIYNYIDSYAG